MDSAFKIAELAEALSLSYEGFRKRYKDQIPTWQTRKIEGKNSGGGNLYIASSLPSEIQAALTAAGKLSAPQPEPEPEAEPLCTVVEVSLPPVRMSSEKEGDRRAAVIEILEARDRWCCEQKVTRVVDCDLAFADAYNDRKVDVSAETFALIARISRTRITRWRAAEAAGGTEALKQNYGNRKGKTLLKLNPDFEQFCLAMLKDNPTISPKLLWRALQARFKEQVVPCAKSVARYLDQWKKENTVFYLKMRNPDAYRNKLMPAFGSYSENLDRPNQLWELDSTPADIMLKEGRYHLVCCVDVYTRRAKLLLVKTSRASAIAALLRTCILDWGVPESIKTDNGKDYVSHHITRIARDLQVEHFKCQPFQPQQKPHVERFLGTFNHDLVELLPGYLGANVAERQELRSRQSFADRLMNGGQVEARDITAAQFQGFCDQWVAGYLARHHDGIGCSPLDRLAQSQYERKQINDVRGLDLLLAEAPRGGGIRTVQKQGIRVDGFWFGSPRAFDKIGQQVQVLYDPCDLGRLIIYEPAGDFVDVAECPELTGIDRAAAVAAINARHKEQLKQARLELNAFIRGCRIANVPAEIMAFEASAANVRILARPSEPLALPQFEKAVAQLAPAATPEVSEHEMAQSRKGVEKQRQARAAAKAAAVAPRELEMGDWEVLSRTPQDEWLDWQPAEILKLRERLLKGKKPDLFASLAPRLILNLPPVLQQAVPEAMRLDLLAKARALRNQDAAEKLALVWPEQAKAIQPVQ